VRSLAAARPATGTPPETVPIRRHPVTTAKSRYPHDRSVPVGGRQSVMRGGASGAALGVGERAELAGPVVADRVDADDLAVLAELDRPARLVSEHGVSAGA